MKERNPLQCLFCTLYLRNLACIRFPEGIPGEYLGGLEDCYMYKDPEDGKGGQRKGLRLVKNKEKDSKNKETE